MCELASWIDMPDGSIRCLTGYQVFSTPRGDALRTYCQSHHDYTGHGAIRWYYNIPEDVGINHECNDFRSPLNFPREIVAAITAGQMRGLGTPDLLLSPTARTEIERVCDAANADYERICDVTRAHYLRVCNAANPDSDSRNSEYERLWHDADDECNRVVELAFWDMFAQPENRAEAWR